MVKENMDLCFCFSGLNHDNKMNIDVFYVPKENYRCYLQYYDGVSFDELIPILHKMIMEKKKFRFNWYL